MGLVRVNDVTGEPPLPRRPVEGTPRTVGDAGVIYTTGAAAKLCGLSQQTIIRAFDTGTLKGYRVPSSKFRRIPRAALLAFMLESNIPITSLGELSEAEAAAVTAARGEVLEARVKLTTADRLSGVLQ
jgi:excisionase family DNA binding protein